MAAVVGISALPSICIDLDTVGKGDGVGRGKQGKEKDRDNDGGSVKGVEKLPEIADASMTRKKTA